MGRRVDVEVGRNGQVKIEFSGFEGDLCFEEAEGLKKILRTMGLWALPVSVAPKTASEIEFEMGTSEDARKKVPIS